MKQSKATKENFIKVIGERFTVKETCNRCGLSRQTIYRWFKEDKKFKKEVQNTVENAILDINDDCENRILQMIGKNDKQMIKFWLKYHHRDYKQSYIITK